MSLYYTYQVPFNEEIVEAAKIKNAARLVVGGVLEDARNGEPISLEPVQDSVKTIMDSMQRNTDSILSLSMLKQHDEYTFMHSVNVGVLIIAFCRSLGMDEEQVIAVGVGGMLHDVGKTRVSKHILDKPSTLTTAEWTKVRRHVELGKRILQRTPRIQEASIQVADLHHERIDGSGYPGGLLGEEISTIGKMSAIVDIYDAITTSNSYRKGQAPHNVLRKLLGWSKTLLDNVLCQRFINCVGVYPMGSFVQMENGLLAVVITPNRESLLHPKVNAILDSRIKKRIEPKEINLMEYKDKTEGGFNILKLESQEKWGIDPREFMPMPELFF